MQKNSWLMLVGLLVAASSGACGSRDITLDSISESESPAALSRRRMVPTAPGAPTASSVTDTTVALSWSAADNAWSYTLERASDVSGTPGTFETVTVTGRNILTYTDAGLTAGTTYWYRVHATNGIGTDGPTSDASRFTTVAAPVAPTPTTSDPGTTTGTTAPTTPPPPPGVVTAFPGAQGGGALSAGGRGGTVYEVTNLNDSGPGSLRACVQASGPRTCVFRVSGVIPVVSRMAITNPYLTIAGQTAPGGGVAVAIVPGVSNANTYVFDVNTHDVVIRYLRIWGDHVAADTPGTGEGSFGVVIHSGYNVMVDHCDLLWFTGKAYGIYANQQSPGFVSNNALSWSLVGENLGGFNQNAGATEGQETPMAFSGANDDPNNIQNADLHHNIITSAGWRHPVTQATPSRIVNNLIHWGSWASAVDAGGSADFIGNFYKTGDSTGDKGDFREIAMFRTGRGGTIYVANNRSDWVSYDGRGTVSGSEPDSSVATGQWSLLVGGTVNFQGSGTEQTPLSDTYRRRTPFCALGQSTGCTPSAGSPGPAITASPVSDVQAMLTATGTGVGANRRLNCDGTWTVIQDSAEARILRYTVAGTGYPGYWDLARANLTGVLPTLAAGAACADADHDGMPDAWEAARGLDPNDRSDAATIQADGYTNLEHYLNGQ